MEGGKNYNNDNSEMKIFVGGLSWESTVKDIREYFEKFGTVTDATLKTDPATGRSRGFGFVTFDDKSTVDKVVAENYHSLHGKKIDPKRAMARGQNEGCKKVFVGGLDPNLPESDVREFFSQFGTIESIDLPYDKIKNQRRAFAFITFDSEAAVNAVCVTNKQTIHGKEVDVKKATPQNKQQQNRGGFQQGGPAGWGGPHGGGPGGGYDYNQYYQGGGYGGQQGGYGDQGGYGGQGGYGQQGGQGGYDYSNYYQQQQANGQQGGWGGQQGGASGGYDQSGGYGGQQGGYDQSGGYGGGQQGGYGQQGQSGYGGQGGYGGQQGSYDQSGSYGGAGQDQGYQAKSKGGRGGGQAGGYHPYSRQ